MPKIIPLSEEVITKIAAGEVIERPLYVVKELVENSLDSGADVITIHVDESGLQRVVVRDNGEGMSKEDLQESIKSHTTSKIATVDHLRKIKTHGFRGEALASIAGVSKLILKSKTKDQEIGTSLEVEQGKLPKISPIGIPSGTEITVLDLFSTVPGRKNFLKSSRTEFRHIAEWFCSIAIAHPSIRFTLYHNDRLLFDLPKTTDISLRVRELLGPTVYSSLIPLSFEDSYITLRGFITKPHIATTTKREHLYINGRKVTDRLISLAVKEAYATLIEQTAHPVVILFLELPYELVDVNVHPRKEEVRFVSSQLIFDNVYKGVKETLLNNNLTLIPQSVTDSRGITTSLAAIQLKEEELPWELQTLVNLSEIMQLHNLYFFTQTKRGMLLIDQHAAHERILYEQYKEVFLHKKETQPSFQLQKPLTLEVSFSEKETLLEYMELFSQLGFEIELRKNCVFSIRAIPQLFQDRNIEQLLREMLGEREQTDPQTIDSISSKMIAYLACRKAIKSGDKVTKNQAKELVEQLEKTKNNATCPHGRPTKVEFDLKYINTLFKRNKITSR